MFRQRATKEASGDRRWRRGETDVDTPLSPNVESIDMNDILALILARRRIHEYADGTASWARHHADAMECRGCEEILHKGINAYKWLRRAEETMREADSEGLFDFDSELRSGVGELYEAWLQPLPLLENWIVTLQQKGFCLDNLAEFEATREAVQDAIDQKDWQSRATRARVRSSADESW